MASFTALPSLGMSARVEGSGSIGTDASKFFARNTNRRVLLMCEMLHGSCTGGDMPVVPSTNLYVSCFIAWLYSLRKKVTATALCLMFPALSVLAGGPENNGPYKVLPPIERGNLAIFPVVSSRMYDTSNLLTLDEGIRTGQVVITEAGSDEGLIRPGHAMPVRRQGADVNRLVLYNNSNKPLLLLAGEMVTGGKQDRVIAADRIVPVKSGPIELSVFCVEPGRWVGATPQFSSMGVQMAQPS